MSWIRSVATALLIVCVAALLLPGAAWATGEWRWPLQGAVSLEYGARYTSEQGRSCSHGGIDIAADAGASVSACGPGEVVFSGLVPAGEGARAVAVTVLTADGLKVTYMPLERAMVKRGDAVSTGGKVGELAAFGDASTSAAHLHLSVRRGERALDPRSLLGAVTASAESVAPPASAAPKAGRTAAPSSMPVQVPAASAVGIHATAASTPFVSARSAAGVPAPTALSVPIATMPGLGALHRIPPLAVTPQVKTAAVAADVGHLRDLLASVLVRLALAGAAGACVWPVLRGVLAARHAAEPACVTVRHDA